MPGTELRPPRRAQTNGVSKQRKKQNNSNLKRQLITITAVIDNTQTQPIQPKDCLAVSRNWSTSPDSRRTIQQYQSQPCPPPQVVLFYDHINGNSPTQRSHEEAARYCRSLRDDMSLARTKLQSLLPTKEQVGRVAEHASRWMPIYHGLYSLTYTFRTGFQLVATYERMHGPDVHPVLLASYLLCLAISFQQAPSGTMVGEWSRSEYVGQACDVVEEVIVRKNVLAGTVEGLETCMLLLMLASGRNDLTTICLTLKRLVALADLMGLPKAGYEQATSKEPPRDDPHHLAKLRIWEAICATDRNFGMMLKLPSSTTNSIFPLHRFLWRDTGDVSQSYNYYLARICGMVIAIDRSYSNGDSEQESYKMVSTVDRALETLASQVPKTWLSDDTGKVHDLIVKFWHPYITARAHLRPAMILKEEYQNSRAIVQKASFEALRMFCGFRGLLPRGFYYCRVLDIQAFTAAVLLLLFKDDCERNIYQRQDELISRVIGCFKTASADGASSFARKAVQTISSLQDTVRGCPNSLKTVHIPLLGNVRIENHGATPPHTSMEYTYSSPTDKDNINLAEESFEPKPSTLPHIASGISFSIDFENDSPWTPPASRAGGYGRD